VHSKPASMSRKRQAAPASATSRCGGAVTVSGRAHADSGAAQGDDGGADRASARTVNRAEAGADKAGNDKAAFDKARRALYDYWKA
jgi:hypothetical protein